LKLKNIKQKNWQKAIKEDHEKIKNIIWKGSMIFEYQKTWKIKKFWVNSGGGEGGGGEGGEESDL
jgi:hypothetical protein